jgi:LytS/YehU family sensor histidine kinase
VNGVQQDKRNGIGLANVRKRLALLYPGNHELRMHQLPDSFEVFASIPLTHDTNIHDTGKQNTLSCS